MAFEARFLVGQLVLAPEPVTPRYMWGIIKRVINVAREDGGPHYEVQFLIEPPEELICILAESYIFESARALQSMENTTGPPGRPKILSIKAREIVRMQEC